MADDRPGFFAELKRRNVLRAAVLYIGAVWAISQGISQLTPALGLPEVATRWFLIACVIGFPFWVSFAWLFEFTPHGVKRESEVAPDAPTRHSNARRLDFAIIGVMAVAIGLLAWRLTAVQHVKASARVAATTVTSTPPNASAPAGQPVTAQSIQAKSVAVLPFESLSADKNNAYFADGIQDLILTKLADIGGLKVIARTSTMSYGSRPENLTLVGKQLGVATILEGSVQKAGNQVLIDVQLIDAKTDSHVWAHDYVRTLTNIFGVEGEVAGKVAAALDAKLTSQETAAISRIPTDNPQAYTLYLKSQYESTLYLGRDGQPEHLLRAEQFLQQAVAHDPYFAAAYAALAQNELLLLYATIPTPDATLSNVRAHAEKAISLQPDLAGGYIALSQVLVDQGNFGGALREMQVAARLAVNNAYVQGHLSTLYAYTREWNKSLLSARRALNLDPRRASNYQQCAKIDIALRRYDDAMLMLERGLAISPNDQPLRSGLASLYLLRGQPEQTRIQLTMLSSEPHFRSAMLARSWLLSRNYPAARKAAEELQPNPKQWIETGYRNLMEGIAATLLGDRTGATIALDKARNEVLALAKKQGDGTFTDGRLATIEMWANHRAAATNASDKELSIYTADLPKDPQTTQVSVISFAPNAYETRAEIFAHFGDANHAIDILRKLFETKGTGHVITVPLLRLAPVWDPIRHDPAFQALLIKYGGSSETQAATSANAVSVPYPH